MSYSEKEKFHVEKKENKRELITRYSIRFNSIHTNNSHFIIQFRKFTNDNDDKIRLISFIFESLNNI